MKHFFKEKGRERQREGEKERERKREREKEREREIYIQKNRYNPANILTLERSLLGGKLGQHSVVFSSVGAGVCEQLQQEITQC